MPTVRRKTRDPLAKARAIGRRQLRKRTFWPMPIRESDVGHVHVDCTIRPLAKGKDTWTGTFLVDTGATDTFVPASVLRKLGFKPVDQREYELADGRIQVLDIAYGGIEVMGRVAGGTLVFAAEHEEPLLGVTVLESAGFAVDPRNHRLIPSPPKR